MATYKTADQPLVTIQAVRVANDKMIMAKRGLASPPALLTPRVASAMRDVAAAGQHAMQVLKET